MFSRLAVIVSILLASAPSQVAAAQAPAGAAVKATISATTIALSDSLELVIEASAPENDGLRLPSPTGTLGDFTIARSSAEPQRLLPGLPPRIRQQWTLTLHPGLPGVHLIPPLVITSGAGTVATAPIEVTVTSVLPAVTDGLKPRPHKPALDDQSTRRRAWFLLLALVAACAGWLWHRRRQTPRRNSLTQDPDLSPASIAWRALEALPAHASAEQIHAVAMAYLTAELGPHATAVTAGDPETAQRPGLEAYLRSFDEARFSRRPQATATRKLRKTLQGLIMEAPAP